MSPTSVAKRTDSPTDGKNDKNVKKPKVATEENKEDTTTANTTETPYDIYFKEHKEWMDNRPDIVGQILIKGIESNAEESDEEEEPDPRKYTTEQMNSLRRIMLTKNRHKQFDEMEKLVLGDQAGESFMMFSTSYSYQVLGAWEVLERRLPRKKPFQKLDCLTGFTYNLLKHDVWMHDNEGDMDVLTKGLSKAWKNLLKKNNDEKLGWDTEYTKLGVMELLKQFKDKIEDVGPDYGLGEFIYE